jgi:hypothetical protein
VSFLIGPPNAGLTSVTCFSALGVVKPRAFKSAVKLLLCIDSLANDAKTRPRNVLPPSFGMTFTRTPPSAASAETPEVSIVTSCVLPMFGTYGVLFTPADSIIDSPFIVVR